MIPLIFLVLSFSPCNKPSLDQAKDAFLEGNFYQTENILNSLEQEGALHSSISLYRGILRQAMRHFCDAEQFFLIALSETNDEREQQEIILSLALNAIFETNIEKLEIAYEQAKKMGPFSSHLLFIEGMLHYAKSDHQSAILSFLAYQEALKTHENVNWIDDLYAKHFSPYHVELYLAHALLEAGEIEKGRDILKLNPLEEAYPLLGLSYLIESKPLIEKDSYHQLAACYLERSSHFILFSEEKILREIEHVLTEMDLSSSQSIQLLQLLEKWKDKEGLQRLAQHVAMTLNAENALQVMKKKEFPLFLSCLDKEIITLIKRTSYEEWSTLWERFQPLEMDVASISLSLQNEIIAGIPLDDEKLQNTLQMLKIWEKLEKDPEKRNFLAGELTHQGKLLWLKGGEEKKGTKLIKAAMALATNQEELIRSNLHFFEHLYTQAENSNLIKRLLLIHEALEVLALEFPFPPHPTTIGNYLADAEYHFGARNYCASGMHAELIMKMDPYNEEALRIFGLSLYHMGEYSRALSALKRLTYPDDYAEKALMLSIAHAKSEQERHLVQVDILDSLSEDD